MKKPAVCYIIGSLFFLYSCTNNSKPAVTTGTVNKISLDSFIKIKADSLQQSEKFPGIFIGVLDSNRRFYYGAGFSDPEVKIPFDSLTLFEAGSITKTFTAFILEKVLEEKNISDSAAISPWLPDSLRVN